MERSTDIYARMFDEMRSVITEALEDIDKNSRDGEPVTDTDKAKFALLQRIFAPMAQAVQDLKEAGNGNRE